MPTAPTAYLQMSCLVAQSTMLKLIIAIVLKTALAGLMSDLPLPRCADFTDLKLYVYDLPEAFNVHLYAACSSWLRFLIFLFILWASAG